MLKGYRGFAIGIIVLAVLIAIMSRGLPSARPPSVQGNAAPAASVGKTDAPASEPIVETTPEPGPSTAADPGAPFPGAGAPMVDPQGIDPSGGTPSSGSAADGDTSGADGAGDGGESSDTPALEGAPAEQAQP